MEHAQQLEPILPPPSPCQGHILWPNKRLEKKLQCAPTKPGITHIRTHLSPSPLNRGALLFAFCFLEEEGGDPSMPIETRRNISGRHEMQCVFGVTVSGPETTLRFAVRFAVAQQRFREFGRKRGVRPLFRDFESSLTLHRFSSFFVFPSRAKIRRRSIVVASPYSFSLSLLLSVFLIIILLSTDEICLMSI